MVKFKTKVTGRIRHNHDAHHGLHLTRWETTAILLVALSILTLPVMHAQPTDSVKAPGIYDWFGIAFGGDMAPSFDSRLMSARAHGISSTRVSASGYRLGLSWTFGSRDLFSSTMTAWFTRETADHRIENVPARVLLNNELTGGYIDTIVPITIGLELEYQMLSWAMEFDIPFLTLEPGTRLSVSVGSGSSIMISFNHREWIELDEAVDGTFSNPQGYMSVRFGRRLIFFDDERPGSKSMQLALSGGIAIDHEISSIFSLQSSIRATAPIVSLAKDGDDESWLITPVTLSLTLGARVLL